MTLLIRRLALLMIVATSVAVVLSRLYPPATHWRLRQPAGWVSLKKFCMPAWDRSPLLLEVGTGRLRSLSLPDTDCMDAASCSPWLDEDGRVQVVGRWAHRMHDGPGVLNKEFGLARCTFPDGEVLDRVPLDVMPSGPPCWLPGTRARVAFAAGDGKLYRFDFEPERGRIHASDSDSESVAARRAVPLEWHGDTPGDGDPFILDPCWPDDPRMAHYLVVSLRIQPRDSWAPYSTEQLWWLKLDDADTAIVAAGRMISPESNGRSNDVVEERYPTTASLPDGRLALAYLTHRRGDSDWRLCLLPIPFDSDQRVKTASQDEATTLAQDCLPTPPAFSTDGRLVGAVQRDDGRGRIVRIPIGATPSSATAHRTVHGRSGARS